jgi:hypothetical protein
MPQHFIATVRHPTASTTHDERQYNPSTHVIHNPTRMRLGPRSSFQPNSSESETETRTMANFRICHIIYFGALHPYIGTKKRMAYRQWLIHPHRNIGMQSLHGTINCKSTLILVAIAKKVAKIDTIQTTYTH